MKQDVIEVLFRVHNDDEYEVLSKSDGSINKVTIQQSVGNNPYLLLELANNSFNKELSGKLSQKDIINLVACSDNKGIASTNYTQISKLCEKAISQIEDMGFEESDNKMYSWEAMEDKISELTNFQMATTGFYNEKLEQVVFQISDDGCKEVARNNDKFWDELEIQQKFGKQRYFVLEGESLMINKLIKETEEKDLISVAVNASKKCYIASTNDESILDIFDAKIKWEKQEYENGIENAEQIEILEYKKSQLVNRCFPELKKLQEISDTLIGISKRMDDTENLFKGEKIPEDLKKSGKKEISTKEDVKEVKSSDRSVYGESHQDSPDKDIDHLLVRIEELSIKSWEIEDRGKECKHKELPLDSLEVKSLMSDISDVRSEIKTIQGDIQAQIDKINQPESKTLQVVVVNDGSGVYKEIAVEGDKMHFLSSVELERMGESEELKNRYGGGKILAIEIDKEKYLSIQGLTPDVALAKDKLLKAEGTITYSKDITFPKSSLKQKESNKAKGFDINQSIQKVVDRSNKNVLEAVVDNVKLWSLIVADMFKGLFRAFKKENQEVPKVEKKKEEELLQVVAVEQPDGSLRELKTERNQNLFLNKNELKSYVDDIVVDVNAGNFYLLNISQKEYPDVNKFLQKGIMTEESKEKYQSAKSMFFKTKLGEGEIYKLERKNSVNLGEVANRKEQKKSVVEVQQKQKKSNKKRKGVKA